MQFTMSDLSLLCKSEQLTRQDVEELCNTTFDESIPVTIHGDALEESALLDFCQFLQSLRCLYITVYFEEMDYPTGLFIYNVAKKNPHTLKVKLDLGETFLGYLSACALNNFETQDIVDHLISGIYSNIHHLALHYRSMSYVQADKIARALRRVPLPELTLDFNWLDEETFAHLKSRLKELPLIKVVNLSMKTIDCISLPPTIQIAASSSTSFSLFESVNDVQPSNCLQRTLTWMMSKLSCKSSIDESELGEPVPNKSTNAHYKRS